MEHGFVLLNLLRIHRLYEKFALLIGYPVHQLIEQQVFLQPLQDQSILNKINANHNNYDKQNVKLHKLMESGQRYYLIFV